MLHAEERVRFLRILRLVGLELLHPLAAQPGPARADTAREVLAHLFGHEERLVLRPAVEALGGLALLDAQGLAVRGVAVLLGGRPVADQRRTVGLLLGRLERAVEHGEVVRVSHAGHVPAVRDEAGGYVLAEGQLGVAFDRDAVVVVDPDEVVELEVAGQGGGLTGDAFHHAAVSAQRVDVEVEHLEVGTVELRGHPLARHGHADAGGHALPEGPGGGLDAGRPAVLGMARAPAVELPEPLDVLERHREVAEGLVLRVHGLDAREVQHRVEQHGGVPHRQHETIAIGPDRVRGIEAQMPLPQRIRDRRHRHRCSRVSRVRLLHRVHGQRANRVDGKGIDVGRGHDCSLRCSTVYRRSRYYARGNAR